MWGCLLIILHHWWKPLGTPGSHNKRPDGAAETMRNFAITCVEEIYFEELSNLSAESFSISTGDDVTEEDWRAHPIWRCNLKCTGKCITSLVSALRPFNNQETDHTKNTQKTRQSKPHLMLIKSLLITPKNNYPKRLFWSYWQCYYTHEATTKFAFRNFLPFILNSVDSAWRVLTHYMHLV